MEDPITFDVWGRVRADMSDEARALLTEGNPNAKRLSILQATVKPAAATQGLRIVENVGWSAAQAWRVKATFVFRNVTIYQCGYGPANSAILKDCPRHRLCFGGILGCPVCRGFHA